MATMNKLTDREIRSVWGSLKSGDKAAKLFDGGGLFLHLHPPKRFSRTLGAAYWRLKYRVAGVEKLLSCGVYPEVTLAKARERRDYARAQIQDGKDPSQERKLARASQRAAVRNTFKAVATEWIELHKEWRPDYRNVLEGRFRNHVYSQIGEEPIASITQERVLNLLRRIEEAGSLDTAHRIRREIDRVFRFAARTSRSNANPTPHPEVLSPHRKVPFRSVKDPVQIGELLRAIRSYRGSYSVRNALQLAPLLFVRPGELRRAEWKDIDFERKLWTIPEERMKGGRKFLVPLSTQALAILKDQHAMTRQGRYVFPSARKGDLRCMSNNTVLAALGSLGYGDLMTGHGFRHMASTLLHESNKFRSLAIERQMAHVDKNIVRGIYNAAEYIDERTRMMQWWADYLDTLAVAGITVISISDARKAG